MTVFVILPMAHSGRMEYEILNRLAAIRRSGQSDHEQSYQGFLMIATFLQAQGTSPVPPGFKRELKQRLDEFYGLIRTPES